MATEQRNCAQCGRPVIVTENGVVHDGGGVYAQKCKNCGWTGGQAGGYQACPRCGDQTNLVNEHAAQ